MDSRGIRNNNYGNIRYSRINRWKGLIGQDKDGFCRFQSADFGLRALIKLLRRYYYTYGLHSVRDIIQRYAPASENDVASYVRFVSYHVGLSADCVINDFLSLECRFVQAICLFESAALVSVSDYERVVKMV